MTRHSPLSAFSLHRKLNPGSTAFLALLDQLPYPALLVDWGKTSILYANAGVVELTAFTREELQHLGLPELIPGLDRRALAHLLKGGPARVARINGEESGQEAASEFSASLVRRKGAALEIILSPTVLDAQKRLALMGIQPVNERRQQEADRQRQANLFQALQSMALSAQETDLPAALQKALEAGRELTGADLLVIYGEAQAEMRFSRCAALGDPDCLPAELLPTDLIPLSRPQLWTPGRRAAARLQRAARAANLGCLATVPLGQPRALIGLLVAGKTGPPSEDLLPLLGILSATITAILQNHGYADGLRQEMGRFLDELARGNTISETMSDGVVVIAPDLTILSLNPSAEAILGYAGREVAGQPYLNILVGAENLIPAYITESTEPVVHHLWNVSLYRRDGRPFLANVHTLPVHVGGKLTSLVVMIEDQSQEEQFRLRSQQLEQRALLGEITMVFAHEVRNPINNISTGLQLMSLNLPPTNQNQEIIARLQGDCARLEDLMRSVLAFARPVEYKLEPVDLGMSIRRVTERWRPHMARVNVQYSLQIDPDCPPVAGDLRALEQVWNNLISNAIQAMEETGGTLTLKVRPATAPDGSQRVEVSVTDTGPGIPEEVRERIFEPFFTTKRSGTGLGLAITKQIVTYHKGSISVSSIPGGTVFQVQLPLAAKEKPEEVDRSAEVL